MIRICIKHLCGLFFLVLVPAPRLLDQIFHSKVDPHWEGWHEAVVTCTYILEGPVFICMHNEQKLYHSISPVIIKKFQNSSGFLTKFLNFFSIHFSHLLL